MSEIIDEKELVHVSDMLTKEIPVTSVVSQELGGGGETGDLVNAATTAEFYNPNVPDWLV